MSFDEKRRVHYFHSEATAIGGHVVSPFVKDIPVQSPASLPPPGGSYEASTVDFRFENIISAAATRTRVEGNTLCSIATTRMLSVVEDLDVVERVHVDQAVAYISTEHSGEGPDVPRVDFGATNICGLRVDDAVLKVHFALDLLKSRDGNGFPQTSPIDDAKLREKGTFNAVRGLLQCSLATRIEQVSGELNGEIIRQGQWRRKIASMFVILAMLGAGGCRRPVNPDIDFERIEGVLRHGDLNRAHQEADHGARSFADRNSEWHWRYTILDASALNLSGKYNAALALLASPLPDSLKNTSLALQKSVLEAQVDAHLQRFEDADRILQVPSGQRFFCTHAANRTSKRGHLSRVDGPLGLRLCRLAARTLRRSY